MAAGIDGHATVREVRLGSIGTRRKKAPKGVPSDAAAPLTATGEADEVAEARRAQGRLLSTLLAGIAQFECELIRERTGEDRKRAMAAIGRPARAKTRFGCDKTKAGRV